MSPVLFDLIVVALLLLSAGLGFMRGFVNEVFTIFGWIGAVIATIFFFPALQEFGRQFITNPIFADLATASAIFMVTLGVFSLVSYFATRTLQASKLSFVDRSLGLAFGLLRAVVLFGLGFLLFSFVFAPDNRPDFIQEARTRPFLELSAEWMQILMPGDTDVQVIDDSDGLDQIMRPHVPDEMTDQRESDA